MKTLKIDLIPEQKANTVYTIELDKAEIAVIRVALGRYHEDRVKFFLQGYLDCHDIPVKVDAWIQLAKELESSLPDIGE
jgi:hypothetical protein